MGKGASAARKTDRGAIPPRGGAVDAAKHSPRSCRWEGMAVLLDSVIAQVHSFRRQLRIDLDTIALDDWDEIDREAWRLARKANAVERITRDVIKAWVEGKLSDANAASVLAGLLPS